MSARPAWLVVIDMQEVFADQHGEWGTPGFSDAEAGVRRLLLEFRGRTVFTRFVAPAAPEGAWADYYERWPFALQPEQAPLWRITGGLEVGEAPVVTLPTFGKWGPELSGVVGPGSDLVLVGVSTDCCVLSTALAAADAGRHVQVVGDACAGLSQADHRRALQAMALYAPLVEITTVAAVAAPSSAAAGD